MTENSNSLIDETFRKWIRNSHLDYHDRYVCEAAKYAWKAACDHYVPKLTEAEAVDIAEEAINDHEASYDGINDCTDYALPIVKALAAAGVRFKQSSEGTDNG